MPAFMVIAWLVSIFLPGHSILANLTNEQVNLANFAYMKAVENNISPEKFLTLMACESQLQINAKGDWNDEQKKYLSFGILQFQKATFNAYSKKYSFVGQYLNPYSQISLAVLMIGRGEIKNWYWCGLRSRLLQ